MDLKKNEHMVLPTEFCEAGSNQIWLLNNRISELENQRLNQINCGICCNNDDSKSHQENIQG